MLTKLEVESEKGTHSLSVSQFPLKEEKCPDQLSVEFHFMGFSD